MGMERNVSTYRRLQERAYLLEDKPGNDTRKPTTIESDIAVTDSVMVSR